MQGSEKSDVEDDNYDKDKIDFDKQFYMTKGENFLELKVKRYLFADVEEYIRVKQM